MNSSPESNQTWRIVVAYDGRGWFGWQRLADKPTIQAALENAITEVYGERTAVHGAGRTDRGAHAEGQAASFVLATPVSADVLSAALNAQLPRAIRICEVQAVAASFHARESAVAKTYEYRIDLRANVSKELEGRVWHAPGRLDVEAMKQAAPALVGRHDFASFATKPRFKQKSTVRTMHAVAIESDAEQVTLRFEADGFLNHMVRNLVRALVKVGEGRYPPERIQAILEAKTRAASPGSAPASGLYLMQVSYPDQAFTGQTADDGR